MDKKQVANAIVITLAIFFIVASVASSKTKTLRAIKAGSIKNVYIANNAVNSAKIEDGTVSNADLAANSVDSGKIADGSVADSDLTDGAVTSAKIALGTITNANVAASAAIAGTKVSPNFGSQNVATSGDINATSGTGNFFDVRVDNAIQGMGGGVYVDDDLTANGLKINPSGASGDGAGGSTLPSEACNGNSWGSYEFVDDTNMPDGWLYICEQTGASTYAWKKMTL
jgi:hypothetical protein